MLYNIFVLVLLFLLQQVINCKNYNAYIKLPLSERDFLRGLPEEEMSTVSKKNFFR